MVVTGFPSYKAGITTTAALNRPPVTAQAVSLSISLYTSPGVGGVSAATAPVGSLIILPAMSWRLTVTVIRPPISAVCTVYLLLPVPMGFPSRFHW